MYRLQKVHEKINDHCPPFRPVLSAINTPNYTLEKFLVTILKSLTSNKYAVKDSFALAEEFVEQMSEFLQGAQMLILFLIISHLKRLLTLALTHFLEMEIYKKIEFKELLSLATKTSYFIFNGKLYKLYDGVQLQVRHWLMLFLYTLKGIGYKIVHVTLILTTTSSMLVTPFFYSFYQNIQKISEKFCKQSA